MGRIADFFRNLIPSGRAAEPSTPDVRAAVKAAYVSGLSYGQNWLAGLDTYIRPFTYNNDPEGWLQAVRFNVWASNCVDAREKGIASVGFKVCRMTQNEGDEPEKVEHPVVDLINHANTKLLKTETSFKGNGERQLSIFGDWYTHKVRGADGRPREIFILPTQRVECLREDRRGYVVAYRYDGVIYPLEDIVRIYYPSDRDPIEARSPTSTAINAINRYNLADLAQQYIDQRGGRGGGILSFDASYLNTDIEKFMAQWDAVASDPRNAGRDAALPPGATYTTGVLTALQQQREERSKRLMKEIFAAYHVPPAKAGDYTDASVLANADQQDLHFAVHFQVPELDFITEMLTVDLLWQDWPETKDQGLYIAPCYEDIPALNKDERLRAEIEALKADRVLNLLQGGAYSLNEAREELGMDKVNDPRADDVMIIMGGESEGNSEQKPDTRSDADGLNTSSLSTIRQVAQAFSKGEMDEQQARRMLLMAKPGMTDEEMADLLILPVPPEPDPDAKTEEQPDEEKPTDIEPALKVLTTWREGTISDKAAAVLLSLALPEATPEEIDGLLTEPELEGEAEETEEVDEGLAVDSEDEAIDTETQALLEGLVFDNTSQERPATPEKKAASARLKNKRQQLLDTARERQASKKKKGRGRKPKETEAQKEQERGVSPVNFVAAKTMPIVDFVGMNAVDNNGVALGVIEKICRFGVYDGIEATKAEPVVIVSGKAYHSSQVNVRDG